MTSLERRREGRYQRRKAAREEKKRSKYAENDRFENIASYKSLYQANKKSMRNVSWKTSVQRYQMNLLRNMEETRAKLMAGENVTKGFVEFNTIERGKLRHIRSVHYSERVVQRSTCDNALVPMLRRSLIYDNGACLEDKGVDWAMDRLTAHLQQFYRANGFSNDGYIVIFDFSGYFDNILHKECFNVYSKAFRDDMILALLQEFVIPFGFPLVETNWKRSKQGGTGEYTGKSLGLGSQISQITAVSYPNELDHFIKQVLLVRWYARYMDDGYMIFKTRMEAEEAMERVISRCERIGITVNRRKTKILPICHEFRFLKVTYRLTEAGKVILKVDPSSVTRERRKLKKMAAKVASGEMTVEDAKASYGSWKGYALRRGGDQAVAKMDDLFVELFGIAPPKCKLQKIYGGKYHADQRKGNHADQP